MVAEYYPTIAEFIRGIVSYHGSMTIDDLIELIKIYKGQRVSPELAIQLGGLVKEGNIVRLPKKS